MHRESYISAPEHQLRKHQQKLRDHPQKPIGSAHEEAQLLSNKTHYSPHDPDAIISVKPDKAKKLNYCCNMAVDTAESVISHVQADFADGRDSQYLPGLTHKLQSRLKENELTMRTCLSIPVVQMAPITVFWNKKVFITGWVPVSGVYKSVVPKFTVTSSQKTGQNKSREKAGQLHILTTSNCHEKKLGLQRRRLFLR